MKIAIASGKGGTGKTTLAVNLALRAAETMPVALLDLDVEEPNGGIFIQAEIVEQRTMHRLVPEWDETSCTLCGKCAGVCRFNTILKLGKKIIVMPELCHSCHACSELCPAGALPMREKVLGKLRHYRLGKLDFVESKLEIGVEMASPLIGQTIGYAESRCPGKSYVFRDCPPGTSCAVMDATKDADFVILVTEPTPFGLHDLGLAVETMRHLGKPMAVVINRMGIGNNDVLRYCESERLPVWGKFPNRREIAELYSRGELIYPQVEAFRLELDSILQQLESLPRQP